jgi:hypothetical protein
MTQTTTLRRFTLSILGGLRRDGRFATGPSATLVTLIGGLALDLREAEIPAGGLTLTKVSLIGGTSLVVPPGTGVEVRGFNLLGGRKVEPTPTGAPLIRVRAFGIVGGVSVRFA